MQTIVLLYKVGYGEERDHLNVLAEENDAVQATVYLMRD